MFSIENSDFYINCWIAQTKSSLANKQKHSSINFFLKKNTKHYYFLLENK